MDPEKLGRHDSWEGVRAVVAGFGVSGFAAADNLNHLGASVVALDEVVGDREAQAEPARGAGPCALPEAFEDMRQERWLDAGATVLDGELGVRAHVAQHDLDGAVRRRELHGIAEDVVDHLLQSLLIGMDIAHGL